MKPAHAYAMALATLVVANLATNQWLPSWTYVPVNLMVAAGLVILSRGAGVGWAGLGLEGGAMLRGLRAGAAVGALAAGAVVLVAVLPLTEDFFVDERSAGIGVGGLLYQLLVRIPLGTALAEEIAFRGALHGLGEQLWGLRGTVAISALLFGLWHVAPTLSAAGGNAVTAGASGWGTVGVVVAAVTSTALAGLFFSALRLRTGSLVASIVIHAVINAVAFAISAGRVA